MKIQGTQSNWSKIEAENNEIAQTFVIFYTVFTWLTNEIEEVPTATFSFGS